ncbi:MAG TPA: EamA family transporter [Bryobacteraceae bacterium]|nr:EamA family transporter [Bryobacteraceae bacterium]HOQ45709.1 EamA family transporter [Bryobacteraceae bacterium]HPU71564.1 EamA family transporter [Bryobacteraceae bacterium]
MPRGGVRTSALVAAVVLGNVFGNFSLSQGMNDLGALLTTSLPAFLAGILNPWVGAGVCVLILAFLAQLSLLSRADLSYVMPVTSVSYVGTAIMGRVFLDEEIELTRWAGIGLITIGAALVGRTKLCTTPRKAAQEAGAGR